MFGGGVGAEVGVVEEDFCVGGVDGVVEGGRGDKETVKTRGTREGASRVMGDVVVGVGVVGDVGDVEVSFESIEKKEKGGRGRVGLEESVGERMKLKSPQMKVR